jgi:hypothetical protein
MLVNSKKLSRWLSNSLLSGMKKKSVAAQQPSHITRHSSGSKHIARYCQIGQVCSLWPVISLSPVLLRALPNLPLLIEICVKHLCTHAETLLQYLSMTWTALADVYSVEIRSERCWAFLLDWQFERGNRDKSDGKVTYLRRGPQEWPHARDATTDFLNVSQLEFSNLDIDTDDSMTSSSGYQNSWGNSMVFARRDATAHGHLYLTSRLFNSLYLCRLWTASWFSSASKSNLTFPVVYVNASFLLQKEARRYIVSIDSVVRFPT